MADLTEVVLTLKLKTCQSEIDEYGIEGLEELWIDILERHANEDWYNPFIVERLRKERREQKLREWYDRTRQVR